MTLDDRLESGERFRSGLAKAAVTGHRSDLAGRRTFLGDDRSLDGHDFAVEATFGPRLGCAALRLETERVDVGARDATLLGNSLRRGELVAHVDRPVVRVRVSCSGRICLAQEHTTHSLDATADTG